MTLPYDLLIVDLRVQTKYIGTYSTIILVSQQLSNKAAI